MKEIKYVESVDYFPKSIREKHNLGEYAKNDKSQTNKEEKTNEQGEKQ